MCCYHNTLDSFSPDQWQPHCSTDKPQPTSWFAVAERPSVSKSLPTLEPALPAVQPAKLTPAPSDQPAVHSQQAQPDHLPQGLHTAATVIPAAAGTSLGRTGVSSNSPHKPPGDSQHGSAAERVSHGHEAQHVRFAKYVNVSEANADQAAASQLLSPPTSAEPAAANAAADAASGDHERLPATAAAFLSSLHTNSNFALSASNAHEHRQHPQAAKSAVDCQAHDLQAMREVPAVAKSPAEFQPKPAVSSAAAAEATTASIEPSAELQTPAKSLVTALSEDQLLAILTRAGMRPATADRPKATPDASAVPFPDVLALPDAVATVAAAAPNASAAVTDHVVITAASAPLASVAAPMGVAASPRGDDQSRTVTGLEAPPFTSQAPPQTASALAATAAAPPVLSVSAPSASAVAPSATASPLPLIASDPTLFSPDGTPAAKHVFASTIKRRMKKAAKRKREAAVDEAIPGPPKLPKGAAAATQVATSGRQMAAAQATALQEYPGSDAAVPNAPKSKSKSKMKTGPSTLPPRAANLPPPPQSASYPPPPPTAPLGSPAVAKRPRTNPSGGLSTVVPRPATTPKLILPAAATLGYPPTPADAKRLCTQPPAANSNLLIMQEVHGFSPVPAVGDKADVVWLRNVQSLVYDSKQKFSLTNAVQAIGRFAIGPENEEEIFLGDQHHHSDIHAQVGIMQ